MSLQTTPIHSGSSNGKLLRTLALGSALAMGAASTRAIAQEPTPIPPSNEPVAAIKQEATEPQQTQEQAPSPYWRLLHCASDIGMGYLLGASAKNRRQVKPTTSSS